MSALLLFLLILSISIGPRLRLSGDGDAPIDIRYQDILLLPIMFHLLVSNAGKFRWPMAKLVGAKLPIFLLGAILATLLISIMEPEVPIIRRAFFLGRGLEIFIIASAAAGLYISAGTTRAPRAALRAVYLAAYGNAAWMAYQMMTGETGTLLGSSVGAIAQSYGPKLIGEGSAFGTGQFFAFTAAVAVAQLRAKQVRRFPPILLLVVSAAGAWISQSRISIGVVAVCIAVLLVLSDRRGKFLKIGQTGLAALILWGAGYFILPQLQGRQSTEGIEASLDVRVDRIWEPLMEVLGNNPLLGAGPGGLVGDLPVEAHNIFLRAAVDYGLVFGAIFIWIFLHVTFRALGASRDITLSRNTRMFGNLALLAALGIFVSGFVQDALTGVMSSHLTMLAIGLLAGALASSQDEPALTVKAKAVPYQRTRWLPEDHPSRFKKATSKPSRG